MLQKKIKIKIKSQMRTVFTNFLVDELLPTKLSLAGFQLDY